MTLLDLPHLLEPALWTYLSEGKANLCVRYQGPDEDYKDTVLRVRKCPLNTEQEPPHSPTSQDIQGRYAEEIIGPLLGSSLVPPSLLLRVHADFLYALEEAIYCERPIHRRHQSILTSQPHATLLPDLTATSSSWPAMSMEIKPKWGFLPKSRNISQERAIKRRVCRHCLKTRSLQGLGKPSSSYCPMDLYSIDSARMHKALISLYSDPPSNRLTFFREGKVCSKDAALDQQAISLCKEALPPTFPLNALGQPMAWSMVWDAVREALSVSSLLPELRKHQERLYGLSIEGSSSLYQDPETAKLALDAWGSMSAWKESLDAYLSRHPDEDGKTLPARVHRLLQQCMAATLQDLSIMITLHPGPMPVDHGKKLHIYGRKGMYLPPKSPKSIFPRVYFPIQTYVGETHVLKWYCRVSVVDLDPKPVTRIPHWDALDRDIAIAASSSSSPHTFSCTPPL
ncbi:MAG: inositol-pentakisphosphate 2-kinase [Piptocephalis tieghemiana]|nr:MAG: inositol-pentakisphosphate 2-kinase [Piptocephalis tieghemiana]